METKEKYNNLKKYLAGLGSLAIGFSGGVDSTFLAVVAHEVLGCKALAVTVLSPFCPEAEGLFSEKVAKEFGLAQKILQLDPLANPQVVANPPDRCYFCKKGIFSELKDLAKKAGIAHVADGTNADDVGDYRPGMVAIKELGIISPLLEVGLTKAEIRQLSKELGLPTWHKESAACLASRIPYGETITPEKLKRVEQAEAYLSQYGFTHLRVRSHEDIARIEVGQEDFNKFASLELRNAIGQHLKALGYKYVALDLQGYRTGSLNEVLQKP